MHTIKMHTYKYAYYKHVFFKVPQQQTEESELGHVESLQRSAGSALISYHEFKRVQCY